MIIFEMIGWNGFSIRKGTIKGHAKAPPITTIRLGFFCITIASYQAKRIFMGAVTGMIQDKDWVIKNTHNIHRVKAEAAKQARENEHKHLSDKCARDARRANRLQEENTKLATENHSLRSAIKIIES